MSIFSWVSLSTTLVTRLVSLMVSFWSWKSLQLEGLLQPFVGLVVELLAVQGEVRCSS